MSKSKSNEWEFQGQVLTWINELISKRPGLGLEAATQEPSKITSKRSDLVVWRNRSAGTAFFTIELKTPKVRIDDLALLADASAKASQWEAPCFAIWNMQTAELYRTPKPRIATPAIRMRQFPINPLISSVDDWLVPSKADSLKADVINIFETAWEIFALNPGHTVEIEASVFVDKLSSRLQQLRSHLIPALRTKVSKNAKVRRRLKELAAEQGFAGFVENIDEAIAGQYAYRLIGQILFYFALRRKQPSLPELSPDKSIQLLDALLPFWNKVRRFDYEALFKKSALEDLVPFPSTAQIVTRQIIEDLQNYDWNTLRDDVLGSAFENLIPTSEQMLLGQFYTPRKVADLLVGFAVDPNNATVLDPGCGSGTFVMRAYDFLRDRTKQAHEELLSKVWGFDISAFATELASINLFRQDMSAFDNFPRVVSGNFFERYVGEPIPFPPAKGGGQDKIMIDIPKFSAIVANPPYLRSQHQDDLNPEYKKTLFAAAGRAGIKAPAKTDLFAFFLYKSLDFLRPGGRIGFVVSSSWLTSEFGATLQHVLLTNLRLVAVIGSRVESFFSQVQVNTVLIVAEHRTSASPDVSETIKFVRLNRKLDDILESKVEDYWNKVMNLVDSIEMATRSQSTVDFQVVEVPANQERDALTAAPNISRNWSVYLRAPLTYFEIFEVTK